MRDLFPFAAPAYLEQLVEPWARSLNLPTLPFHIHESLFALVLYFFVQKVVSPALSPIVFPGSYPKLNARAKLGWDVHVVSFFQSCLICALALHDVISDDERRQMSMLERVHGYEPALGMIAAFGLGYFTWDLIVTGLNVHIFGFGMLAHAISAVTVFSFGFRPFLYYYCPTFLLYELSSPFLNIHWFFDKLGMTGSLPQLVNGILLLCTFAGCRLVWGTYSSVRVFADVYRAWRHGPVGALDVASSDLLHHAAGKDVPLWLAASYLASNLTLNSLNWYWFGKMIATIRRRFDPPFGTKRPEDDARGAPATDVQVGRSVYEDGTKGVEVSGSAVRRRPTLQEEIEREEGIM